MTELARAERANGRVRGMETVASFHVKGTSHGPEEETLLAGAAR